MTPLPTLLPTLLPCPFCGEAQALDVGHDGHEELAQWTVYCRDCGAVGPPEWSEEAAVAEWGRAPRREP